MKKMLITGGTGSLGYAIVRQLKNENVEIVIYSRDEFKQHQMKQEFGSQLHYVLGDVRDYSRLKEATRGVDTIIHAAALKQVPAGESNVSEFIKTNVDGTRNVIAAANDNRVPTSLLVSSDKAVMPINLYGTTKLTAEKLFVEASTKSSNRFIGVRYGNVAGSRGSVIPFFQQCGTETPITNEEMTRFWISLKQATIFILDTLRLAKNGEIFVPKLKSFKITDLAKALNPETKIKLIGTRPGEKIHELLFSEYEVVIDEDFYYRVLPQGSNSPIGKNYSSQNTMPIEELKQVLNEI